MKIVKPTGMYKRDLFGGYLGSRNVKYGEVLGGIIEDLDKEPSTMGAIKGVWYHDNEDESNNYVLALIGETWYLYVIDMCVKYQELEYDYQDCFDTETEALDYMEYLATDEFPLVEYMGNLAKGA